MSLLAKQEEEERHNNNFFGNFKGFSITPLQKTTAATPLPETINNATSTTVPIRTNPRIMSQRNSLRSNSSTRSFEKEEPSAPTVAPMLPPMNPGSQARPLISNPVLATTTCTSMELNVPKVPVRPAPDIPANPVRPAPDVPVNALKKPPRPISTTPTIEPISPTESEKKLEKTGGGGTLNRIASILRSSSIIGTYGGAPREERERAPTNKIDKEILRGLEISGPIPQRDIELSTCVVPVSSDDVTDGGQKPEVPVVRAQSMRDKKHSRPRIPKFGSMRHPPKRPTSIPTAARPTSPPPGPPVNKDQSKVKAMEAYQVPRPITAGVVVNNDKVEATYDDCMTLSKISEESPTSDNIYAVIEEMIIPAAAKSKPNNEEQQHDNSMGLLSEIVSEISNRNFDSIYSTSTIARKDNDKSTDACSLHYKSPISLYSNSTVGNSSPSSSPRKLASDVSDEGGGKDVKPIESKAPAKTTTHRVPSELTTKSPPSPKKIGIARTKTPPGITTSVTAKIDSRPRRPIVNGARSNISPDLVSSCSKASQEHKSPDVLGIRTPTIPVKPTSLTSKVAMLNQEKARMARQLSMTGKDTTKSPEREKATSSVHKAASSKSNVSSLQQKFEGNSKQTNSMKTASIASDKTQR